MAVLVLSGMSPLVLKPLILSLTVLVALVVVVRSYLSGILVWRLSWRFALGSIPAAFFAASTKLKPSSYLLVLGLVLVFVTIRLFFGIGVVNEAKTRAVPIWLAIPAGAAIGLVAGIVGIGGGIFLSPLLLLMRWAKTEEAVGAAAPFVLVNSIIVFALSQPTRPLLFTNMLYWTPAAFIGAWIGTELDMRVFPAEHLGKAVAILLGLAALKVMSMAL
jgi:uncharacterized membrane protein YfcA